MIQNNAQCSVVVCCKNRIGNLKKSLRSWIKFNEINEIIILDYGSDIPITTEILQTQNTKIKLFRHEATYWHLSKAYNIAMQLASNNILLKLDCDYFLYSHFFVTNKINNNEFMRGYYGATMGMLMLHKEHFYAVNGYNENIVNYGVDDSDMYRRLRNLGLKQTMADKDTVRHLPHPNILRTKYQPDPSISKRSSVKSNRQNSINHPWTSNNVMSKLHQYEQ